MGRRHILVVGSRLAWIRRIYWESLLGGGTSPEYEARKPANNRDGRGRESNRDTCIPALPFRTGRVWNSILT
jgi:hypothetical protein